MYNVLSQLCIFLTKTDHPIECCNTVWCHMTAKYSNDNSAIWTVFGTHKNGNEISDIIEMEMLLRWQHFSHITEMEKLWGWLFHIICADETTTTTNDEEKLSPRPTFPQYNDDIMAWNPFPHFQPLQGKPTGHRCIPLRKGQQCTALMLSLLLA